MSRAYRIAERWVDLAYPDVKSDSYVKNISDNEWHKILKSSYNKLPTKCKEILKDVEIYLCGDDFIATLIDKGILGLCRPEEKKVYLNVQRFEETSRKSQDFESLIYHEIAHFMVHHFSEKEKAFYFKLFGIEPVTSGEPEADGFVAYMKGLAPYKVNEFWSWWAVQGIN